LGAVTSAQVDHDLAIIADRQPMQRAIGLLGSTHDQVQREMANARARYDAASGGFDQVAQRLSDLQAALERLGATVTGIEGTRFSLPSRRAIPGLPAVKPAAAPAAPPPVQGTTGASGAP